MYKKLVKSLLLVCLLLNIFAFGGNGHIYANGHSKQSQQDVDFEFQLDRLKEFATGSRSPVPFGVLEKQFPNVIISRGSEDQKQIALTFDDGPDPRYTGEIMDILKEYDVKATFFVLGAKAKNHPHLVERMYKEGHAIGNHTYWHPNLANESTGRMEWEINETTQVINQIIGIKPRIFRPPYGNLTVRLTENLANSYYTAIGWAVDTEDWRELSAEKIEDTVLNNVTNGSIVLFHDGGHWTMKMDGTVQSLKRIIPELKQQGYEFVTVNQFLQQ